MAKYQKKPVVIEAFKWVSGKENCPDWFLEALEREDIWFNNPTLPRESLDIRTLEGVMRAEKGDYIIKGVKGEIYPCKPDIFELTYYPVEE